MQSPKLLKFIALALLVLLLPIIIYNTFIAYVAPGHIGIKVSKWTGEIHHEPVPVGWSIVGPGVFVVEYPTFTQTYTWTKDKNEGSPTDESMSFQAGSGVSINTDISLSYTIDADKAYVLYQKYKRGYDEITTQVLRNALRNGLNAYATQFQAEDLLAGKKVELAKLVQQDINEKFATYGIHIDQLGFVNNLRLPDQVQQAITNKIQMTQEAMRKEAELRKTQAEAAIVEAQAAGQANARLKIAKSEAEAIELVGKAIREQGVEAARIKVQQEAIQKWNGQLPTTITGEAAATLLNIK